MSTARLAAYSAVGLSIISLIICVFCVPSLWTKISEIHDQLAMDMDEFRVLQDDIWKEMVIVSAKAPKPRKARQAGGQCCKFIIS